MGTGANKLGKLSLAILEKFVEGILGKKFVDELRAPTDQFLAIQTALDHTENRFIRDFMDKDLAKAMFVDLPADQRKLGEAVRRFYDHPADSDFHQTLESVLTSEFKHLSKERVNTSVEFYIKLLKQEFALADDGFREKIRALADLETLEYIRKIDERLKRKKESKKKKSSSLNESSHVQLILSGTYSSFDQTKQDELIIVLAALLHVSKKSIRILRTYSGSIVVELKMNQVAANKLLRFFDKQDSRLNELRIISINLIEKEAKMISSDKNVEQQSLAYHHSSLLSVKNSENLIDVFFSYNGKDRFAVEALAYKLEKRGLKVWLDRRNLVPGEPWQEALEEALDKSQTFAVFVGPSDVGPWENEEMRSALETHLQDRNRRVIPVLLPGVSDNKILKLPRFLRRLTWVDFRSGLDNEEAFYQLERGIKGISAKLSELTLLPPNETLPQVGDLPIGSRLPFPPNALFTGRIVELKKLANGLLNQTSTGTVTDQTVTGMGGIGKTQLAVEFAYRYGRFYRGVHWLNLVDPTVLDSEIAQCGMGMVLPNWPDDQPSQVALTLNTWQADGPRLLVLDNFEAVEQLNSVLPRLRHSNLRLLITSRRTDWPSTAGLSFLPLELFAPEESLVFLRKALNKRKDSDEDLMILAERLGHLPLALELASRYLNEHPRLSLDKYLFQAKEAFDHPSMHDWRKDLPSPTKHDLDLERTFALSWQAVKEEIAQKIFQMSGYLAPNTPIPPEIFEKALGISTEILDENLVKLYGLGLLRQSENAEPTIHPLLAEYARGLTIGNKEIVKTLANALQELSNDALESERPIQFIPLRSHMPVLAAHSENAKLELAGALWDSHGRHLLMVADYSGARVTFEHALKLDEATFGSDDSNVAARVNSLGNVMKALGDLNGARTAFERALRIDEAAFGADHPNVAIRVNNLGIVMMEQGDLNGARAAIERALKIDEAAFGPNHPLVAIRVNNLGQVLQDLSDLTGAKAAYERALKIDETAFGPDHPKLAIRVNNLGSVLQNLGDLAGAKAAYERALKIDETAFGPDHPNVAMRLNNLSSVMRALGELEDARATIEHALKIDEAALGPDHPNVAIRLSNLGRVMTAQGDLNGARTAFERALKVDEAAFGHDNHPNIAIRLSYLGTVIKAQGDRNGARTMYERALRIFKKFLPPDHPRIKTVEENLDSLNNT